jgi:hypothetical protein
MQGEGYTITWRVVALFSAWVCATVLRGLLLLKGNRDVTLNLY